MGEYFNAGELYDEETGLYYLRARYYDPIDGRFITKDTYEGQIDNPLTLNLYTYVGNNPMIRFDPTGNSWISNQWNGFVSGMKQVHSSWESGLGYWTMGLSDPFFKSYRAEPFSKEYWAAQAEIGLGLAFFGFGGAIEKQITAKILQSVAKQAVTKGVSAQGLIGVDFENFLTKQLGGKGSFKVEGRDFDGGLDNVWWEAKSGNYWRDIVSSEQGLAKFKSDMGHRLDIATRNGAEYMLYSNTAIPDNVKQWLTKKGMKFVEWLD